MTGRHDTGTVHDTARVDAGSTGQDGSPIDTDAPEAGAKHNDISSTINNAKEIQQVLADSFSYAQRVANSGDSSDYPDDLQEARRHQLDCLRQQFQHLTHADTDISAVAPGCFQLATYLLQTSESSPTNLQRKALGLVERATKTSPDLLQQGLLLCVHALISNGKSKAVNKRLRHTIRQMIEHHGLLALASLAAILDDNSGAANVDTALQEWATQARRKLATMPITPDEWIAALGDRDLREGNGVTVSEAGGWAKWIGGNLARGECGTPTIIRAASWNANSIWARLRTGGLANFIEAESPDMIHISEIKGSVTGLRAKELRAALLQLGFEHCIWNWCSDTPHLHGSAIFSKVRIDRCTFGVGIDGTDPEGRTITTWIRGAAWVWCYSPCSSLGVRCPESRRTHYDEALNMHVQRLQGSIGPRKVFVCGDLNIAPSVLDSTLDEESQASFPSSKEYEREAYRHLLETNNLKNAADAFSPRPVFTWSRQARSMTTAQRIDHLLAPPEALTDIKDDGPHIRNFRIGNDTHGSDHFPQLFDIVYPDPPEPGNDKSSATAQATTGTQSPPPASAAANSATPTPTPIEAQEGKDTMQLVLEAITAVLHQERREYRASRRVKEDWVPILPSRSGGRTEDYEDTFFEVVAECITEAVREQDSALPSQLASQASALPAYSAVRAHGPLPHLKDKIMPEVVMAMGPNRAPVRTLWDSGAFYNLISSTAAASLGATTKTGGTLPLLSMADGHIAEPMGTAEVTVYWENGHHMPVEFLVVHESPADVMFGSHFMHAYAAEIDYAALTISLQLGPSTIDLPFQQVRKGTYDDIAAMHATHPVMVPPHTEMNVQLRFAATRRNMQDSWGLVTGADKHPVAVQRGLTCAFGGMRRDKHYCRVLNASSEPRMISSTEPLAWFRPIDLQDYVIAVEGDEGDDQRDAAPAATGIPIVLDSKDLDVEWSKTPHLQDVDLTHAKETMNEHHYNRLRRLILDHHDLWDTRPKEPPAEAEVCEFRVHDKSTPWSARTRPMNPQSRLQLRQLLGEQLAKRIIEPSNSRYSSPVVLVPKKGGGIRFAIDYRLLNAQVDVDSYTLPRVDEALSCLHGNTLFTSLDMKEAFWSVPLAEQCKQYTAFQTPDGLYQYRRMPMGLKTASAVFCRYVDRMLGSLKWTAVLAYVDDLLVFTETAEEHLHILGQLLPQLAKFNMTLGAKKCVMAAPSVAFLGHVVDKNGVHPDPNKVAAIKAITLPNSHKDMESAMGLLRYYRKFVHNFSKIEAPIRTKLLNPAQWRKTKGKVVYSDEEEKAFYRLRDALTTEPILGHPDWNSPYQLHTDASYLGLGASLNQIVDGREVTISFASRTLTPAERNYSAWELECLAIVWAMRLFRMYLTCAKFTVHTDSRAAAHLMGKASAEVSGRLLRWRLAVQEFWPYEVKHRPAKRNGDADGLSRLPLPDAEPYGEGPTDIDPAQAFAGKGKEAYFGEEDKTAVNAIEFAALQDRDAWCQDQAASSTTPAHATPGRIFRDKTLLYRKAPTRGVGNDQVLVPTSLRAFILRRYHGLPVSGHLGWRRTYAQIRAAYYWPKMQQDVRRWVAACLACRRRKTPRPMHAGDPGQVSTAQRPWQVVSIDIVSATHTQSGYSKILTVLDLFTRYVLAIPLRRATAREVGGALFTNLFCRFGKPERIHSDEGKEFVNKALEVLFRKWDICHTTTGGYQPQANPVERFHRFLNNSMTMLSKKFGEDWPDYLQASVFSYNVSTNDSTGYSPYELVYGGQSPSLLHDIALPAPKALAGTPSECEYHKEAGQRLKTAYVAVRDQQEKIAEGNRRAIIEKRGKRQKNLPKYDIGDQVLFWEPRQPKAMQTPEQLLKNVLVVEAPRKWKDKWSGPHVITSLTSCKTGFRYTLHHRERAVDIETHVNKLCLYQPWSTGLGSTSNDIDSKRLYKCGEWAPSGALVIVPLLQPHPFGIAKIISCTTDGDLELQWLGNNTDNTNGKFLPGWTPPRTLKPYFAPGSKSQHHVPYLTSRDGIYMNQRDVLMHGFELTDSKQLPAPLLRAIGKHPEVWWTPTPEPASSEADQQ